MGKSKNQFKHKCYLGQLFRYGYFLAGLLLATITATLAVATVKLGLITAIESIKNLKIFVISALGVVGLFVLIYMIAKIRCPRLCVADSIGVSIMLIGACLVAFIFIDIDFSAITQANVLHIVIGCVVFAVGLSYFFFRMAFFKAHERRSIIYIKNSVTAYFSVIGQKYSFASVLLTGLVISSITYLALTSSFANFVVIEFINNRPFSIIMGFAALCFVLYCIIQASEKNVNPVDLILCSGIVFFPISAVNSILLKEDFYRSLTFLALLLALYLMLLIVRLMCFDVTVINRPKNKRTFSELLLSITISSLIVGAATLIIHSNAIESTLKVLGEVGNVHCITFFPVITIVLTAGIALLFNLIIGFININGEKRTSADTLSDASFITSILGFSLLAFVNSFTAVLGFIGWFLLNLMLFIARQRRLHESK